MKDVLMPNRIVAVIGAGQCGPELMETAHEIGFGLAKAGFAVVTGGLDGVMRGASEGASSAGGAVIGLLPGLDKTDANPSVGMAIATGLGQMRNFLLVLNAEAVVAVEGGYGTLSEIALALKIGKPVTAIGRWSSIEGVRPAASSDEAIRLTRNFLGDA
jgi:hypothetical protein